MLVPIFLSAVKLLAQTLTTTRKTVLGSLGWPLIMLREFNCTKSRWSKICRFREQARIYGNIFIYRWFHFHLLRIVRLTTRLPLNSSYLIDLVLTSATNMTSLARHIHRKREVVVLNLAFFLSSTRAQIWLNHRRQYNVGICATFNINISSFSICSV